MNTDKNLPQDLASTYSDEDLEFLEHVAEVLDAPDFNNTGLGRYMKNFQQELEKGEIFPALDHCDPLGVWYDNSDQEGNSVSTNAEELQELIERFDLNNLKSDLDVAYRSLGIGVGDYSIFLVRAKSRLPENFIIGDDLLLDPEDFKTIFERCRYQINPSQARVDIVTFKGVTEEIPKYYVFLDSSFLTFSFRNIGPEDVVTISYFILNQKDPVIEKKGEMSLVRSSTEAYRRLDITPFIKGKPIKTHQLVF